MPRYKAIVSYDGTNYIGWQKQPDGMTIQEKIETVMEKITHTRINVTASGRTDAKVHALGQVFHFDSDFNLTAPMWKVALNGHLPKDIHIQSVKEVREDFHSRFHAVKKRYDYRINLGEYDVFTRNFAFQCYYSLDVEKMKEAASLFLGEHDFTTFCASPLSTHPDQVRTITHLEFVPEGNFLRIIYEGNGFLRYMVRMLTGTLIEVGRGRLSKEEVQKMLEAKDKTACRFNAKPQGLFLVEVFYEPGWEIENR